MVTSEDALLTTRQDGCAACGSRMYRPLPLVVSRTESWRELRECIRCVTRYVRVFGGPPRPAPRVAVHGTGHGDSVAWERPPAPSGQRLAGMTVLVVDDEDDAREMLRMVLQLAGATVVTASGARQGLEVFGSSHPDVLVTDLTMPRDDGYWLLEHVREATLGETPVVSISGVATRQAAVLDAGFDSFLRKPIDPDELVHVVATLAGRPA